MKEFKAWADMIIAVLVIIFMSLGIWKATEGGIWFTKHIQCKWVIE